MDSIPVLPATHWKTSSGTLLPFFPENHEAVFVFQAILSESFEADLTKGRTILRMGCSIYTPDHSNGRDDDLQSLSAPFVITKSGFPTENEVGLRTHSSLVKSAAFSNINDNR